MTQRSVDLSHLDGVEPVRRSYYAAQTAYKSYAAPDAAAPPFLPLGDGRHQVRMTASTHDENGILRHSTVEALDNTRRLTAKVKAGTQVVYCLEEVEGAEALIVTYGITAGAAREAVRMLSQRGTPASLLVAQTLLPVPDIYLQIVSRYIDAQRPVVFAEENLQGQFTSLLFGEGRPEGVRKVGDIGHMVSPDDIVRGVCQ